MNAKIEFAERLRKAMRAAGYEDRPAVLEREFNDRFWGSSVTFQAASRWLRGTSVPTQDKLEVLADWLCVDPSVLRYGEKAAARKVSDSRSGWPVPMSARDRLAMQAFVALPGPQRKLVRDLIAALAEIHTT